MNIWKKIQCFKHGLIGDAFPLLDKIKKTRRLASPALGRSQRRSCPDTLLFKYKKRKTPI
jgi:hypothetical protein